MERHCHECHRNSLTYNVPAIVAVVPLRCLRLRSQRCPFQGRARCHIPFKKYLLPCRLTAHTARRSTITKKILICNNPTANTIFCNTMP